MFERLRNPDYWRHMILADLRRHTPAGSFLGWKVWVMDGKAYLFQGGRVLRADWFEFCRGVRWWFQSREKHL